MEEERFVAISGSLKSIPVLLCYIDLLQLIRVNNTDNQDSWLELTH